MNGAQWHLILNHVPVLGSLFLLPVLLAAWRWRTPELARLALSLTAVVALSAAPAFLTGEPAEGRVEGLPGVAEALISQHESVARLALGLMLGLGVLAVATLALQRRPRLAATLLPVTLIVAALNTGLLGYTAHLGGQIRHTEIRADTAVAQAGEAGERGERD